MNKTITIVGALGATFLAFACSNGADGIPPGTTGQTTGQTGSGGAPPVGSGGSPTTGSGGDSTTGSGGDSTTTDTTTETTTEPGGEDIFVGGSAWVDGTATGDLGIQGSFFVLEDSMKDSVPIEEANPDVVPLGLTFSDLTPDTFDDTTTAVCVNGTIAGVTAINGAVDCNYGDGTETPENICQWDYIWGGGLGFNLNETGGEDSMKTPWDAVAAGVQGFKMLLSGDVGGAVVRFKAKMDGSDEDFCAEVDVEPTPGAVTEVLFSELEHMCWGTAGTLTLDTTKLVQVEWQIVPEIDTPFTVTNFCVERLAVIK